MLINLSELFPIEGKSKTYTQELDMTQFRTSAGVFGIVEKEPVILVITNLGDKLLTVAGEANLVLEMPCDRCQEPVRDPFHLEIDQKLDMNQSREERVADLDERFYVTGYNLDVDQLVGSELTLNMPMKILCSEGCAGICNGYGMNPDPGDDGDQQEPSDPRMSVIQDIFKQLKEV